ncbi:MAG TPA: carotenoid biosynthesis protein [Patescibacteria group bacterium]|nr:carotenoid biosynthesis protein [Patescibacteria group bacterium]
MIKQIHKISKILFLIYIIFFSVLAMALNTNPTPLSFFMVSLSTLIFVALVWIDAFRVLGKLRAVWFIVLCVLISFTSEYLGVNFGGVFGGSYHYNVLMRPMLGGVPLIVIAMWTAVVYVCYRIAVIIADKKMVFRNIYERIAEYLAVALFAALAAVCWDLVWDPLAVNTGSWFWHNPGPYFGIPTLNFVGWIIVVFFSCFIFELFFPSKKNDVKDIEIPFLGYLYLLISTVVLSLKLSLPHFALIAVILMLPYLLVIILKELKNK